MHTLRFLILTLALLAGSRTLAQAEQPRNCIGPFTLNAPSLYGPGTDGVDVKHIDGDMTIQIWKNNNDAISVQIQSTVFTTAEDSLGSSFVTNDTLTSSDQRTLKGPLQRVRFFMDTCAGSCLAYAKICGRVNP